MLDKEITIIWRAPLSIGGLVRVRVHYGDEEVESLDSWCEATLWEALSDVPSKYSENRFKLDFCEVGCTCNKEEIVIQKRKI